MQLKKGIKYMMDISAWIKEKIGNRKLVVWGKTSNKKSLEAIKSLEDNGLKVEYFIDSDNDKIDDKKCFFHKTIKGKKNEIYVFVVSDYYLQIYELLQEYGYREIEDYFYWKHEPVIISQTNDYMDKYGNSIVGNLKAGGVIKFKGYNSKIIIKGKLEFSGVIVVDSDVYLEIGENVRIIAEPWELYNGSNVTIGAYAKFRGPGSMYIQDDANFKFGTKATIANNYYFSISRGNKCVIGENCMISHDTIWRSNDGHTIFDLKKKQNVNSTKEINKTREIIIGDHVWIGQRSTILYNTKIESNSIVGAHSLVKGKFGNNLIVAGVPAKVIRKNITWSREKCAEYIEYENYDDEIQEEV